MAPSFETTNVVWRIDQSYAASAEKIANWLRQLMDLTQKSDKNVNKHFVTNLTIMLMGKFEKWYFTVSSLEYVASQSKFFPAYRELCEYLSAWIELEKYRRSNEKITEMYCNHADFATLTPEAKEWVRNFYLRQSHHWKDNPEESVPSADVQLDRA
ncbi:hypothetical protein, partial [Commensalibacter sp. Nvir]|uniref:hypothetical protein n=1 Tax=Commensalibacter sp. Nvir TaxID=3069817 RepID=UPI0030C8630A